MKRKRTKTNNSGQTKITDLNFDVLKHIMLYVSVSSNGAENLARTTSVCRMFRELSDDAAILSAVAFDDMRRWNIHESFWHTNGLIYRSLKTRNLSALDTVTWFAGRFKSSHLKIKRDIFLARMTLLARTLAVEAVNTRARQSALKLAVEECNRIADASDAEIHKTDQFLEMLRAVIK